MILEEFFYSVRFDIISSVWRWFSDDLLNISIFERLIFSYQWIINVRFHFCCLRSAFRFIFRFLFEKKTNIALIRYSHKSFTYFRNVNKRFLSVCWWQEQWIGLECCCWNSAEKEPNCFENVFWRKIYSFSTVLMGLVVRLPLTAVKAFLYWLRRSSWL